MTTFALGLLSLIINACLFAVACFQLYLLRKYRKLLASRSPKDGSPYRLHVSNEIVVRDPEPKRKLRNGELVCKLSWWQYFLFDNGKKEWGTCSEGVIVKLANQLVRNGTEEVFRCSSDEFTFMSNPAGFVIRLGDAFLRNGTEVIANGKCEKWVYCPKGIGMSREDGLYLNGKLICLKEYHSHFSPHPDGIAIRDDTGIWLLDEVGDQKEFLYPRDKSAPQLKNVLGWAISLKGVFVQVGSLILLDGKEVIYEGPISGWRTHLEGIIVRCGREFRFYNGEVNNLLTV